MKPGLHQSVSMKQEMRMNPRLYQAMDLLYMPLMDLQQHLKTELLSNPFLEMIEDEEEQQATDTTQDNQEKEREKAEKENEIDWEDVLMDGFQVGGSRQEYEEREVFERESVATRDLTDHLRDQLVLLELTSRQQFLAEEFLGNIGDDGYLQAPLDIIVDSANRVLSSFRNGGSSPEPHDDGGEEDFEEPGRQSGPSLKMEEGEVVAIDATPEGLQTVTSEAAMATGPPPDIDDEPDIDKVPYFTMEEADGLLVILQELDPPGIFARNLRECLLLQLKDEELTDTLTYQLVDDAFDDLIAHRWSDLAKRYGLEPKGVQDAADMLAKFDPKPGLQYQRNDNIYITPDLVVEQIEGEYRVFLNDTGMPRLRISKVYQELAGDKKKFQGENREFVTNKLNSATWLIQAIEQRRQTMLKVMNFIDVISMHESTVSRVTNQKYVQTPRGVLPLKFFFSSSLGTSTGEDASARAVKAQIRKLVSDEDSTKPLTDSDLVNALQVRGVKIARRTVAKYRDQLGILPARMRKRV